MLVLALDAATLHISLALGLREAGGERVLAESGIPPGVNGSARLPAAIPELLASAGKRLDDLGGFVVGVGPGSLTGLRVALATVKGIAYARRLPVVGVSSLQAMAHDAPPGPELAVAVVDARRSEVYAGLFRRHPDRVEVVEAAIAMTPALLAERLRGEGPLRIFGPGEALLREPFAAASVTYRREGPERPSAKALLALAPTLPAYDPASLFALEPRYVRAPESEWAVKPKKAR